MRVYQVDSTANLPKHKQNMALPNDQKLHYSSKAWGLYFLLYEKDIWKYSEIHLSVKNKAKLSKILNEASKAVGKTPMPQL